MPSQKVGTESPNNPTEFASQSSGVPFLTAETTPSGIPMASAKKNAITESCSVTGSFCKISVVTGAESPQL